MRENIDVYFNFVLWRRLNGDGNISFFLLNYKFVFYEYVV